MAHLGPNENGRDQDEGLAPGEPNGRLIDNLYKLYISKGMSPEEASELAVRNAEMTAIYAADDFFD